MAFADQLKRWRHRKFLTQKALADAIPVALSTVQRWEMGKSLPYPATRRRLIDVLGITTDEFFAALESAEEPGKEAA